jgi:hypothetical protein
MRLVLVIGLLAAALVACDSNDGGSAGSGGGAGDSGGDSGGDGDGDGDGDGGGADCDLTAPTECPSDMPTYADVEPIFAERCVGCHSGPSGEMCPTCWSLTEYMDIKHWTRQIRSQMLQCAMPPVDSGMTMPDAERMKILEWLRCDLPE